MKMLPQFCNTTVISAFHALSTCVNKLTAKIRRANPSKTFGSSTSKNLNTVFKMVERCLQFLPSNFSFCRRVYNSSDTPPSFLESFSETK